MTPLDDVDLRRRVADKLPVYLAVLPYNTPGTVEMWKEHSFAEAWFDILAERADDSLVVERARRLYRQRVATWLLCGLLPRSASRLRKDWSWAILQALVDARYSTKEE